MVCCPCWLIPILKCFGIPALMWIFHKLIQPVIQIFWRRDSVEGAEPKAEFTEAILETSEGKFIKEKVDASPVILFSKTTCNFCKMAKKVLNGLDVSYDVEEIDGRSDMDALQDVFEKVTGARTVPRIFIGGKCVGGASELMTLNNQQKLVPLMEESGATFKHKST